MTALLRSRANSTSSKPVSGWCARPPKRKQWRSATCWPRGCHI